MNQSSKVKLTFEKFVEKYPDGTMNKDQFEDFMIEVRSQIIIIIIVDPPQFIQLDPNDEHLLEENEIDLLFRIIDDNNSGKIDFMEFMVETSKPHFFKFRHQF